jgi:hypothetical protein
MRELTQCGSGKPGQAALGLLRTLLVAARRTAGSSTAPSGRESGRPAGPAPTGMNLCPNLKTAHALGTSGNPVDAVQTGNQREGRFGSRADQNWASFNGLPHVSCPSDFCHQLASRLTISITVFLDSPRLRPIRRYERPSLCCASTFFAFLSEGR